MADPKSIKRPAARPFTPKAAPAPAPKPTFPRPVTPEKSGTPANRGPDKPPRTYAPTVPQAVEGKGGVTAAISVGSSVIVAAKAEPGHRPRRPPPKAKPAPAPPVAVGMVTADVHPQKQAVVRVSVRSVPLRAGEATTPEYVPPSFRWPPKPAPAPAPAAPPGESGLRALAAVAAAAPSNHKT